MSHTMIWLCMVGAGAITFLLRFAFLGSFKDAYLPKLLKRALYYMPVAILTAFFVPAWIYREGTQLDVSWQNESFWAGLVGVVVSFLSKNVLLTLVLGMLSLWLLARI